MYLLGYDIGSSFVKASLVDVQSGVRVATAFYPKAEMEISSVQSGWAEQEPEDWWENLQQATKEVLSTSGVQGTDVAAIGITYQMHGLVLVDKDLKVLRPSIIGSDSRALSHGQKAFNDLGEEWCMTHLLNSPGNFTASKLAWVKNQEPELYARIHKMMLPGDYIAMKLTGVCSTTVSGLSEGMFWDFRKGRVSEMLLKYYGLSPSVIPTINPTFSIQGEVTVSSAALLGLKAGIPVSYRAGDQPNHAFSLHVLNPGEIALTAGASGAIYGVNGRPIFDPKSRANSFAHVNHTAGMSKKNDIGPELLRIGVLLSIHGTGMLHSWMKHQLVPDLSDDEMNALAAKSPIGAKGLSITSSGVGSERLQGHANPGCTIHNIHFNIHGQAEMLRAAQESVAFSFAYGVEVLNEMGIQTRLIRAGMSDLFFSPVFRETLAGLTGVAIELYDTDGSVGAAKGAGIGAGIYNKPEEAFVSLRQLEVIQPHLTDKGTYQEAYNRWKTFL